jgi:hypothetical protein
MPYDGLFLPYQERWLNLGPINEGLAQYNVTYDTINAYYERIQQVLEAHCFLAGQAATPTGRR